MIFNINNKTESTLWQFFKFGFVGITGLILGIAIINISMHIRENFVIANLISFPIAVTWNYALNRTFTFKQETNRSIITQWLMFIVSSIFGTIANWSVSFGLYYNILVFEKHYNLAVLFGVATGCVFNFIISKYIVFKPIYQKD